MNEGYQQCYNGQLAVDGLEHQIVVLAEVVNNRATTVVLPTVLRSGEEGARAGARAGVGGRRVTRSCNEHDLADLERRGIEGCVNPGGTRRRRRRRTRRACRRRCAWRGARFETEECREASGAEVAVGGAVACRSRAMGFRQFSVRRHGGGARGVEPGVPGLNIRRMHGPCRRPWRAAG